MVAFTSGYGAITTPEQAQKRRALAESLIGRSETPGRNWAEGLSDVAAALTGTVLQREADEAERAAREELGGLFGGLSSGSSEQDLIGVLSNPWATDGERYVAQTLFSNQFGGGGASDMPASVREWEYYNALSPEEKSQYIGMKRSVPVLDLGTEFARIDPVTGQPMTTIAKDNYTPAYDSALGSSEGKATAEIKAAYDSLSSKLPGLQAVVGELKQLARTATYTATGQLIDRAMIETGQEPTENAIARARYIAMVDNQILPLLRDTFGAQFTQKEGESLKATLGNPDLHPDAKIAVLESFIAQKTRDLEAMASRVNPAQSTLPVPEEIQALTDKWLNQ